MIDGHQRVLRSSMAFRDHYSRLKRYERDTGMAESDSNVLTRDVWSTILQRRPVLV
jgi:hypothetical protein